MPSEMGLAALGAALREGEIDLALTYDRGTSLERLEVTRLAALQPQAFVSANHPLAQRDSVDFSDLSRFPYVMFDGQGSRAYFEELLAEATLSPEIAYA